MNEDAEERRQPPPGDENETPAMRRYRRLLRRRQRQRQREQRIQAAQEANGKLKCVFCLVAACGVLLPLFAQHHALFIEGMLMGMAAPVVLILLLTRLSGEQVDEELDDEEGTALVQNVRSDEEILDILIEIPLDADMVGVECDICQEEYEQGDVLAASPNPDCCHLYHQHCIKAWLHENDLCPICRRNYLGLDGPEKKLLTVPLGVDEIEEETPNAQNSEVTRSGNVQDATSEMHDDHHQENPTARDSEGIEMTEIPLETAETTNDEP